MGELEFKPVPPPAKGGMTLKADWDDIAKQLRAHPSEWTVVRSNRIRSTAASTAANIKSGAMSAFQPRGHYDATTRLNPSTNEIDVWATYLGTSGGE